MTEDDFWSLGCVLSTAGLLAWGLFEAGPPFGLVIGGGLFALVAVARLIAR